MLQLPEKSLIDSVNRGVFERIRRLFAKGIIPSINLSQHRESGTTPGTADTEFSVTHGLDRSPSDLELVYWLDQAGDIYVDSAGTTWTRNIAYFKCTVASAGYTIILR